MPQIPINIGYTPMGFNYPNTRPNLVPPAGYNRGQSPMMFGTNGTQKITVSTFDGPPGSGGFYYTSLCLGLDGLLYSFPFNTGNQMMVLNPSDGSFTLKTGPFGSSSFRNIIRAQNGDIIGIPAGALQVCAYRPSTDTFTNFGSSTAGTSKWGQGILAQNGLIYCAPMNNSAILVIDPISRTTRTIGSFGASTNKYITGVLGPNGLIYFFPLVNERRILILDPITETTRFGINVSELLTNPNTSIFTYGGSLGFDNQYYFNLYNGAGYGVFDFSNESIRIVINKGVATAKNRPPFYGAGGSYVTACGIFLLTPTGKFISGVGDITNTTDIDQVLPWEIDPEKETVNRLLESNLINPLPFLSGIGISGHISGCMDLNGNFWMVGNNSKTILKISGYDIPTPEMYTMPQDLSGLPTSLYNKFFNHY